MKNPGPKECTVEQLLVKRIESLGGVCEKVVSPGGRGYFDRVAVMPGGRVIFIETKRPRRSYTTVHQKRRHAAYRALGAEVAIVKSAEDIAHLFKRGVGLPPD